MTGSTENRRGDVDSSLLGVEIDNQFWSIMDRDYLPQSDIERAATKFIPARAQREEVQRWVEGVLAGKDEWRVDGEEPELDPGANTIFMQRFRAQMHTWYGEMLHAGTMDPLTRAAALSASPDRLYSVWEMLEPVVLSWAEPGNDGYIIGPKGSGKTASASLLGRVAIRRGKRVLGGIPLTHEVENYLYCTSGTQMLRTFCLLKRERVDVLTLLDEGFFSYSGETPLKSEVLNFRMFTRLFRKLGASLLDITQYIDDVPKELRRTAAFRMKKLDRNNPDRAHVEIKGRLGNRVFDWSGRVKWIPDGPDYCLPYVTEHIAAFIMDFEPSALMEYLSGMAMTADPFVETLRWLDERGLHFKPAHKRWFARRAVECGVSQGKVAQILGISQGTVSRWVTREERELALDDEFLGEREGE